MYILSGKFFRSRRKRSNDDRRFPPNSPRSCSTATLRNFPRRSGRLSKLIVYLRHCKKRLHYRYSGLTKNYFISYNCKEQPYAFSRLDLKDDTVCPNPWGSYCTSILSHHASIGYFRVIIQMQVNA